MSKPRGHVYGFLGDWYMLTPSCSAPTKVVPMDWYGPPTASEWDEATPESTQDAQLLQLWMLTCEWGFRQGVDEILVEGVVNGDIRQVVSLGFQKKRTVSWRWFPFPILDEWHFSGTPTETLRVMKLLHSQPGYTLTASAQGCERIRLRDNSWDAAYINIEGLPHDAELHELQVIHDQVLSAE